MALGLNSRWLKANKRSVLGAGARKRCVHSPPPHALFSLPGYIRDLAATQLGQEHPTVEQSPRWKGSESLDDCRAGSPGSLTSDTYLREKKRPILFKPLNYCHTSYLNLTIRETKEILAPPTGPHLDTAFSSKRHFLKKRRWPFEAYPGKSKNHGI